LTGPTNGNRPESDTEGSTGPATAPSAPTSLFRFSLEGRQAPALFAFGWLATVLGLGAMAVGASASEQASGLLVWVAGLFALAAGLLLLAGSQTVERRAAGAAYPGPSPVLLFLSVIVVSQLAGYAVGLPLQAADIQVSRPVGDLIAVLLEAAVFIGLVELMVVRTGAIRWSEMGLRGGLGRALQGLGTGALFAAPVILVTGLLAALAVGLVGVTPPSPLPPTGTLAGLVLHLVAGSLVAPLSEEILFRGAALTAWLETAGPGAAIIRSATLFVLAHVLFVGGDQFGQAAATAFVAGVVRIPIALVLGWLYVRTRNLWAPIGLHAVFNGILIVLGETAA
jgi:membrane protease YdiL (CAAX protease family)